MFIKKGYKTMGNLKVICVLGADVGRNPSDTNWVLVFSDDPDYNKLLNSTPAVPREPDAGDILMRSRGYRRFDYADCEYEEEKDRGSSD